MINMPYVLIQIMNHPDAVKWLICLFYLIYFFLYTISQPYFKELVGSDMSMKLCELASDEHAKGFLTASYSIFNTQICI